MPLRAATNQSPATFSVSGFGLFGNRELKSLVGMLERPGEKPAALNANFIEDAILILFSRLNRDGFLHPTIRVNLELDNGEEQTFTWTEPIGEPLPRPLEARKVEFHIDEGVRYYLDEIQFAGLQAIPLKQAAHFFIETDALIKFKSNRVYSPDKLRAGVKNLEEELQRLGYESAAAISTNLTVNTNTGAVTVDIFVDEGPRSLVRLIRQEIHPADTNLPPQVELIHTNTIFSRLWEQDYRQALRRAQYQGGHADVRVEITQLRRELEGQTNYVEVAAKVFPGPVITIRQVEFEGEKKTSQHMMAQRVKIASGDLLNPVKAEQGRYRLARLGIFDSVGLRYDKVDEETRDVVYTVNEGKQLRFSLLAGYGSYEQLRGGFELEQYNLWGLAHHSRLRVVQSLKSSSADYMYTMPDLLGEDLDGFVNGAGLIREEPAFTRKEFGGGAGVSRHFRRIDTDLALRYSYQVLSASSRQIPQEYGLEEATVGSFIFDLRHDRRDNALMPRKGYKVFSTVEVASEALLGEVDFERMESSFSYHHPVGELRWIHFGISHGFVITSSGPAADLPINRRFFPGGDSSIRGYQFGAAAPRNADGDLVGAETYTLGNLEFEQGITRSWSVVAFFDALGQAARIQNYPFNESLFSAGVGLRWKTIIGPVRLEYGRNINPRKEDPDGTLHISIGFPF